MRQATRGRAARPARAFGCLPWGSRCLTGLLLIAGMGTGLAAQSLPLTHLRIPNVSPLPVPAPIVIDPADLAPKVHTEMQRQLREGGIVGAAVAVVKGGQVLLSQGYGYSDLAEQTPVNGDTTLFRAGSVSKLFTGTAVMQLVEQQQLQLDADVNDYLQQALLRIPATYPEPVTLKNLLTHTGGFEVNSFGYMQARSAADLKPFGVVLAEHMPARVRPPVTDFSRGEGAAYCNWCVALAGYVVAQRTGLSFDDYMDEQLFRPLDMHHSSFREPLPANLQGQLSKGYLGGAAYQAHGLQYYHDMAPAGGLSASAGDMARFMLAQLQLGRYQDRRILSEASARLMQSRQLSPSPYLNGGGLGWIEKYWNGRRVIWHPGSTVYFCSELYLLPEEEFGLYVVYNSTAGRAYAGALMRRIMDDYFPAELPDMQPTQQTRPTLTPYPGVYAPTARSLTTWEKIYTWSAASDVALDAQGALLMRPAGSAGGKPWIAPDTHPAVLRAADGDSMIQLAQPADSARYVLGPDPFLPSVALDRLDTPAFNQGAMRIFGTVFAVGLLLAVLAAWRRRHAAERRSYWLAATLSLSNLLTLHFIKAVLQINPLDMMISLAPQLYAVFALGLTSLALCTALLYQLAIGWKSDWPARARLGGCLLAGCAVAFLAWLDHWNLLGFNVA